MQINSDQSLELGMAIHQRFGSWDEVRKAMREKGWSYVVDTAGVPPPAADERPTYTGGPVSMMRRSGER